MANEVTFKIVKFIGVLREANDNGWAREVNLVSWNDAEPKIDIRDWNAEHSKMSKGITLTPTEALVLADKIKGALLG